MTFYARLEQPFAVEQQRGTLNDEQQLGSAYVATGQVIRALVGSALPGQTIRYGETEHTVTHALTVRGPAYSGAKPGDRLRGPDNRAYYVLGIENPALLGTRTVLFTEQRPDQS